MKKRKYTDEELIRAALESKSLANVLRTIGLKPSGGNYLSIRKRIKDLGIDITHFTGQGHLKGKTHNWGVKRPLEEILVEESTYTNSSSLKYRLLKENVLTYVCSGCGLSEWKGEYLSLHLEHKNGNRQDNRLENLILLCPNCHSQTPTYTGRNIGAYLKYASVDTPYCSGCQKSLTCKRKTGMCRQCLDELKKKESLAKNTTPKNPLWRTQDKLSERKFHVSKDELEELIKHNSFCAIGRMFGVSDNSIRKRAKRFGLI